MRLGIITWHYLDNYGSMLQTYAMTKIFEKYNFDVSIINYRNGSKKGLLYNLLRDLKYMLPYQNNTSNNRKKNGHLFRKKYFKETKMFSNNSELINYHFDYDVYVCGSDQIWSPTRFDDSYYLNFVSNDSKKIAYAPSVTIDKYSEEQARRVKDYLRTFKAVSLREEKGSEIIKKISGTKYPTVLDPTLLLTKTEWNKLVTNQFNITDYILCYFIGNDDKYKESVYKYAEITNKKIVNIVITANHNFGDVIIKDAGPEEFLELVNKCHTFLTDSFHGVLFAINYQKKFYAYKRFKDNDTNSQNARVENILTKLDLMDRFIDENYDFSKQSELDYKKISKLLDKQKQLSFSYLNNALFGDQNG